ncbi:DUF2790 domain-containing protein [Pseudomonas sp. AN-1]|uniref:DUF2790 domain-containing protein n=1 Tax=Pseudomonas sp. AN-1 TaxID=3096605 RepID=UPI002A69BC72|nr:DUF2790 domain-containing protein [Pseudomonas sp. AN-1]WPP47872.1 DUF2790 domain-containing protein [Pseudomonas sp. AN-1]
MKALALLLLSGISCVALAGETVDNGPVEKYHYGMDLDVARVISRSEIPDVCGTVPVQMVYEDHQGQRHTLEYLVMGNGCRDG